MAKGEYKIPFRGGNQLGYAYDGERDVEWVDNFKFEDTLTYDSYGRGRSAAHFYFLRKSNGRRVSIFLRDFEDMVPKLNAGEIAGAFTFRKRGQNFGCVLA